MRSLNYPRLNLDALAMTVKVPSSSLKTLIANFDELSSPSSIVIRSGEFSASRYRTTVRIGLGSGEQVIWVQVNPFNERDSPIRIELKGHPYTNRLYTLAGKVMGVLLKNIPREEVTTCVTRIDVAIDIRGSLDDFYCHKLSTKVFSMTFAQNGELVCIRHGKSTSNFYLCTYAKKWKESRYSHETSPGCLRVEMRFKPRVPIEMVLSELNLFKRLDGILFVNRKHAQDAKIWTLIERFIISKFGVTPLIMSYKANEKRQLINRLKSVSEVVIDPIYVLKRSRAIQKQLLKLIK